MKTRDFLTVFGWVLLWASGALLVAAVGFALGMMAAGLAGPAT